MSRCASSVAALLLAAAGGCPIDPYRCEEHAQCRRGAANGTCEPVGFCSYPDTRCESGARYSDNAAPAIAGSCIGAGDEAAPTGGPEPTDSNAGSGGTTGGLGGELRWDETFSGAVAVAVAVREDLVVAVGHDTASAPWAVALHRDGAPAFGPVVIPDQDATQVRDAALSTDAIVLVGHGPGTAGGARAWVASVDLTGAVVGEQRLDTLADESLLAVVAAAGGLAAVGDRDGDGWLRWMEVSKDAATDTFVPGAAFVAAAARADGAIVAAARDGSWHRFLRGGAADGGGVAELDDPRDVAFTPQGGVVVAGARAGQPFVAAYGPDAEGIWARDLDTAGGVAVAVEVDARSGDTFVLRSSAGAGVLERLAGAAEVVWSASLVLDGARIDPADLAIGPDGDLFVSGTAEAAAWVGSFTP